MVPKELSSGPCQEIVWEGKDVDLARLPVQTCWPDDAGPLITWGLTVTRGPHKARQNLGIYRQQVIAPNRVIMRWLAHRGGALDYRDHCARASGRAVSGRRRAGRRSGDHARRGDAGAGHAGRIPVRRPAARRAHRGGEMPRQRPAGAGVAPRSCSKASIQPGDTALEGPYGDHTGYYNEAEKFPVFTVERITMRRVADLPQHLHRQAARRAGHAGRRAQRSVRAAAAEAVSGDRRTSTCRPRAARTGSRW